MEKLLEEYKTQYSQFMTTGISAHKTAYERIQDKIESLLAQKQQELDNGKGVMKHFADGYASTHQDISELSALKTVHDEYEESKSRYLEWSENVPELDPSKGFGILLRIGILMLVVPVLVLIS